MKPAPKPEMPMSQILALNKNPYLIMTSKVGKDEGTLVIDPIFKCIICNKDTLF